MKKPTPPPDPEFIVAEVSKSWPARDADPRVLCQKFEEVVNVNLQRGYKLDSWNISQCSYMSMDDMWVIETIIAVFTRQ